MQVDLKISKKCVSYCNNPTHNKKCGTCPANPTAGPQSYWAPGANTISRSGYDDLEC